MEIVNVMAILFSPLIAVGVTLWYQKRSEIIKTKKDIFFTLMKYRNSIKIPDEWANALNCIDFIFDDDETVKNLWSQLYDNLNTFPPNLEQRNRLQVDLLSQIARHLNYQNLTQMQIAKYYTPQLHGDQAFRQQEISDELLRILKASEHYGAPRIVDDSRK